MGQEVEILQKKARVELTAKSSVSFFTDSDFYSLSLLLQPLSDGR